MRNSKLFIWVFFPHYLTEQGLISQFDGTAAFRQELTDVFAELGVALMLTTFGTTAKREEYFFPQMVLPVSYQALLNTAW